uniref:Uncharacterized protein n=1 Tax=Oncorhynchus kisutch TaxID=8019 RepID=A0A8C7JJH8_ONCKI
MDMLFLWQLRAFVVGLSIVAGCIIIGVSRECDADAVGGIFLGLIRWCNLRQLIASWGAGYSTQPRRLSAVSESRTQVAFF